MEKLSALFTAITGRFTGASWFQYVQWPFWICLFLIALGGVYNARFKKNTLFCRGMTGALKLTVIYLVAVGLYVEFPEHMSTVSQFPFLTVGEKTLTMINPLGLHDHILNTLPEVLVRLYFLLLLINWFGSLDYNGVSFLPWLGSQCITCIFSVFFYQLIFDTGTMVLDKLHFNSTWFYLIVCVLFLLPLTILMIMKFCYIVFRKAGNPTYSKIMQFLTTQRFGSLLTVTFFSIFAVLVFLVFVNLCDRGRLSMANFSWIAYFLILAMTTGTLFVYSMFYTERKAG